MLVSLARTISGMVELYRGSTLLYTLRHTDNLSSITVSRAGENKFFGYGVCQETEIKLVDKDRVIAVEPGDSIKASFTADNDTVTPTPGFYVTEIKRNENTNELTLKAYDAIYQAKSYTFADLGLYAPYTVYEVAYKIAEILGVSIELLVKDTEPFSTEYPDGANLDGTETLREMLNYIAEVTQTIYYINPNNQLVFKHLDIDGEPVVTIQKADYFTLDTKTVRTLADICSATELGDNVTTTSGNPGETQYIRDNPFWELRDDIAELVEDALVIAGGINYTQFSCKWRGNYLVEPGDKIAVIAKDDSVVISYLVNDKYIYNGGLSSTSSWDYDNKNGESADNPTTLGEALKKTYAKVDKANQEIEIVAGETSSLKMTTDSITTTVTQMDDNIADLYNEVNTKVSSEQIDFTIETAIKNTDVEKVTTSTGFTFNQEGLKISKLDSSITTQITEDGMTVIRGDSPVLEANNLGVTAEDLHATTYMIIGKNSRFEDYNSNRTGCFWMGR